MNMFAGPLEYSARMNKREGQLDGIPPDEQSDITVRKDARLDDYPWKTHCRGLYQLPAAA
jgi:hypothetical protein